MENKFLIFIIVVLGVLALVQLVRVYEMTMKVSKKNSEEEVSPKENFSQASLFLVFMFALFGSVIYLMYEYGNGGLGAAASIHGKKIDTLLAFNWAIILPVFFIMNTILFVFVFMYRRDPNRTAVYLAHNNKLEMIWTVVPATVLAAIIIYGLKTWDFIMNPEEKGTIIEVYGEQFSWTARYSGENNELGKSNFKLITGANPLGVITTKGIAASYVKIDAEINRLDSVLHVNSIEKYVDNRKTVEYLLSDTKVAKMSDKIERLKRQKYRIQSGLEQGRTAEADDALAADDIVVKGEIHLIVNKPYTFYFRSKDVMHSAWFPHFRAQMNVVPGMTTSFSFTPTETTKEKRLEPFVIEHYANINKIHNERKRKIGEPEEQVDFDYILMCNKICGAGHSNMQMKIVVDTEEEYKAWIESKKRFDGATPSYTVSEVTDEVAEEIEE